MRVRGFEIAKGWENAGVVLPQRSTVGSAAYDIAAAEDILVPPFRPGQTPTIVPTGLKFYCRPDEYLLLMARSSSAKRGLVLANSVGLIDSDYYNNPENDGHFCVMVLNISDQPIKICRGDRIAQALFQKFLTVDDDAATGERVGGLGSTGVNVAANCTTAKIVYDMDDVLWGLNFRVAEKLGIDLAKIDEYHVNENQHLSAKLRKQVVEAYCAAQTFQNIEFFLGARDILKAEQYGGTVRIHSNCYNAAIADEKRIQLAQLLPTMKPSYIKMSLIDEKRNRKMVDQDAYIFVDDSPYNIANSGAKFNLVPRYPWNITPKAENTMSESGKEVIDLSRSSKAWRSLDLTTLLRSRRHYVIILPDLLTINQFILAILDARKEENDK